MNDKNCITQHLLENMHRMSGDGLVDAVLLAIRTGRLQTGDRLPTMAEMSEGLGLSASTISRAWASLVQMGVLETKRRGGTRVVKPVQATSYRTRGIDRSHFRFNLAAGYPDGDLQVDLGEIMQRVASSGSFTGYPGKDEISPGLQAALLDRMGYRPDVTMLSSDVIGTLPRVLQAVAHRGSTVGIGDPEFPLYPIILRQAGMTPVPIMFGPAGYDVDAIDRQLANGTKLLLLQTRVHNPTGRMVPTENLAQIAELLQRHDSMAIEVDHHGRLVPETDFRLASFAPERVILMSSFAKEIHPDIRVAAISGPSAVMDRISVWRSGGDWVSSVNKALLEACLTDERVAESTACARREYDRRRQLFVEAFRPHGLEIQSNAGLNLWVPVASEQETLVSLAAKSISVAGGSSFVSRRGDQPHVHLSLGCLGTRAEELCNDVLESALIIAARAQTY